MYIICKFQMIYVINIQKHRRKHEVKKNSPDLTKYT